MKILQKIKKIFVKDRVYHIIKSIREKKYKTPFGPEYVTIDITNKCNLNCIGCWTYSPLLKKQNLPEDIWFKQELPFETIKNLIIDLKTLNTNEIRLTGGGEPFLHPKIMKIIRLIKQNGFKLDITTNFTLLNKKKIDELIKYNVDNLTISLWAATSKTYVKTHPNQTEKTFDKIKENLNYLNKKKKNTQVVIANVILNKNYNEIEKMIDFAVKVNANEIYFTLIDPIKGNTDKLLLNNNQQKKLKNKFKKILDKYKKGKYEKLIIDNPDNFLRRIENKDLRLGNYDSNIVLKIPCTIGWTFSRILANGDVAPCCRGVMVPTGNINKKRFKFIWNGYKQKKFREIGIKLKEHPDFIDKVGCIKTCDNLMHNIQTNNLIRDYKK